MSDDLSDPAFNYQFRSEFDRLKRADVEQGKRIADLMSELASLRAENERLRAQLAAADRVQARWVHGQQIESDYICPHELELYDVTRGRDAMASAIRGMDRVECDTAEAIAAWFDDGTGPDNAYVWGDVARLIRCGAWRPGRDGQQGGE